MAESTTNIEVLFSNGYSTDDAKHPVQEVIYGVKLDNGVPIPVIVRRDANTKEVLQDYSPQTKQDIDNAIDTAIAAIPDEVYVGNLGSAPSDITLIAVPTEES